MSVFEACLSAAFIRSAPMIAADLSNMRISTQRMKVKIPNAPISLAGVEYVGEKKVTKLFWRLHVKTVVTLEVKKRSKRTLYL